MCALDDLDQTVLNRLQLPLKHRGSTLGGVSSAVANEPKHPCRNTPETVEAGIAIQQNDRGVVSDRYEQSHLSLSGTGSSQSILFPTIVGAGS